MASLTPAPVSQFFDANGNPLAGGKLYTYVTGTTTPLATYTARAGAANTNPVILNYRGEANVWLGNALYTFTLKNAFDETIWTVDGIGNVTTGFFNVMDYGAVGNGIVDDTAAFKATIVAATAGGVIYAPAGSYKLTDNLNIVWPNLCVLRGDGSKLTTLLDYRIDASVGGLINYNGSSFAGGDNAYLSTWTGGFTLRRSVDQTIVTGEVISSMGIGKGLYLNGVVAGVYSDIAAHGYETNIYAIDCLGFTMRDLYLNQCNYGIYLAGYSALSGPNASVIDNAIISACGAWGVYVSGGMMQITGGTYAYCGTMGTTSGAIYVGGDTSLALPQVISITGGWFEANRGSADVYIENRIATAFSATVGDCLFARNSGTYFTTNNVYALNVGVADLQLVVSGNGFRGYNTYVADAGRKYIATSGLLDRSYIGNTYTDALEAPTLTASNFSVLGWGANGGKLVDIVGVPYVYTSTTSIGIGNPAGGVVLDATAWRPAIAGAFKLGTTTYPFSEVYFGALGGRLLDITGVPYFYTSSTSVGLGNSTGGMVLDASAWRPAIARTFGIGTTTYPVSSVHFGAVSGTLIDVAGVPYLYSGGTSVGIGNVSGYGMVLDATAWRPSVAGVFGIGTSSYPVSNVYFGALGGRLLDITGVPYFYTSSTSVGLGNSTGGVVLDATAWRPAIADTFALGSATYPFSTATVTGTFRWGGITIPAPTTDVTKFLRNDGTWAVPAGSGGGVTSITAGSGLTGGTITTTGTIAIDFTAGNTWSANTQFNGTFIGTYSGVPAVTVTGTTFGIANSSNAVGLYTSIWRGAGDFTEDLGSASYRWNTLYLKSTFGWNGYNIAAPAGSTTTYLRNDGTWATPAGSGGSTDYSYTGTPTGGNADINSGNITYSVTGNIVVMDLPAIGHSASNATTFTITGGPASMRPTTAKYCIVRIADNGTFALGFAKIETSGVITLNSSCTGTTAWTASGLKTVSNTSISYTLV